eukprot:scaffold1003_cov136-Isochrysis_galbana.AAC.4
MPEKRTPAWLGLDELECMESRRAGVPTARKPTQCAPPVIREEPKSVAQSRERCGPTVRARGRPVVWQSVAPRPHAAVVLPPPPMVHASVCQRAGNHNGVYGRPAAGARCRMRGPCGTCTHVWTPALQPGRNSNGHHRRYCHSQHTLLRAP